MSVQNLLHTQPAAEGRRPSPGRAAASGTSFQDQLAQTASAIQGPDIHLRRPVENTVFSGGCGGQNNTFQEIYAEYTADSTPENPIVRISGTSDSGPYDFTCQIQDIDPSNASYAELAALYGHLVKTGAHQSALPREFQGVLPTGMGPYDVSEKRDYIGEIRRFQDNPNIFGPYKGLETAELLALYQSCASGGGASVQSASVPDRSAFMKQDLLSVLCDAKLDMLTRMKLSKEKADEREDWERIMNYVDAWIETLREEADLEKIARAHADLEAAREDAARGRKDLTDQLLDRLSERLL